MTERANLPHFSVIGIDGTAWTYAEIWQRKNLLLVLIPRAESPERAAYVSALQARMADLTAHDTSCLITSDDIPGVRPAAIVVADQWGEIAFIRQAESLADLPEPDAIIDWLRHVQGRCPECEGEAR